MRFVIDPAIATKIARMNQRVRWQHPLITQQGIDQTRLVISPEEAADAQDFSFLVIGDSGTSRHLRDRPQRRIAKRLLEHSAECAFILHTGDVVYLAGSSEQYPDNFIKPYREFIVGGESPDKIRFDKMTFKLPFLPVLGNHDYYDLSITGGLLSKAFSPLRRLLRKRINLDVGWHGSFQGEGFAKAFLDCLESVGSAHLASHVQQHYTSTNKTEAGRCLSYVPGQFTRLPNRYYSFRQGGIDFFALDSNTFNAPQPLPETEAGQAHRKKLEAYRDELNEQMRSLEKESDALIVDIPKQAKRATHIYAKVEQLEEQLGDIEKQLNASQATNLLDVEQLDWLRDRLIDSWGDPQSNGRVLYFHHPPYVTEKTKWFQAQTLAVRLHLRQVLDEVAAAVGAAAEGCPLVDLVLSGHAHCFEYLTTVDTGHGDRNIPWVVCGGSGFSLRRQRKQGPILSELGQPVATSHLFVGRSGTGSQKRRPYSALRVDVKYDREKADAPPRFILRPLIAEHYQGEWCKYDLGPIDLSDGKAFQGNREASHSLSLPEPTSGEAFDSDHDSDYDSDLDPSDELYPVS
jgi:3',5'-cyclic AMP phosphodiesterase CpdA